MDHGDAHDEDGGFRLTQGQGRQILNLLDVVDQLEKFSVEDKQALAKLIDIEPPLTEIVEARKFWIKLRQGTKRLAAQIAAFVALIAALNELWGFYQKWSHH